MCLHLSIFLSLSSCAVGRVLRRLEKQREFNVNVLHVNRKLLYIAATVSLVKLKMKIKFRL